MPLSISKRLTLRHFFSSFVQCSSAGITVGQRTQSDWTADAIRSDGGRNLTGRRTQSDRTADAIRSDGERDRLDRRRVDKRRVDDGTCETYIHYI